MADKKGRGRPPLAEIDKNINAYYRGLAKLEAKQTRQIEKAMAEALKSIDAEVKRLEGRVKLAKQGKLSLQDNLFQLQRLQELQKQARAAMYNFGADVARAVGDAQTGASAMGEQLTIKSLQAQADDIGRSAGSFSLLPQPQLNELTGQLSDGSPLSNLANQFGNEAAASFQREITRGIALGLNPHTVATNWQKKYPDIAKYRANRIMRTEMARASREASRRSMEANGDVVKEWQWYATIGSSRTCPMCYAMHGKKFPLKEKMASHPNCRCTMLPVTMTFEELGISGVAEAAQDRRLTTPGPDLFAELDEKTQRAVLGGAAYRAYKGGAVTLPDFVGNTDSPVWGKGRNTRSLKAILGPDADKWYAKPRKKPDETNLQVVGFANGQVVKVPKAKAKAEDLEPWVREARERIAKGINSEADARELGAIIRKETGFGGGTELRELNYKIEANQKEIDKTINKMLSYNTDDPRWEKLRLERNRLQAERSDMYAERDVLQLTTEVKPVDAKKLRDNLAKVRPGYGTADPKKFKVNLNSTPEAVQLLEDSAKYYPKEWVEEVQKHSVKCVKSGRGYMNTSAISYGVGDCEYAVFVSTDITKASRMAATAVHEMGHYAEGSINKLVQLEAEFYQRRTKGERAVSLRRLFPNSSYSANEKTKVDQFASPYMGKYYNHKAEYGTEDAYEILTMGAESLLVDVPRYDISVDEDMADFVLGLLAGV